MENIDFKKCMNFIAEIDKLKSIYRRSKLINKQQYENDAEHSWHICVMAHTLHGFFCEHGKNPNLEKSVKMLLLHDLVEVYAGDTYCYDSVLSADKYERELNAAYKIFGMLPDDLGKEYMELWLEFDEEQTEDAVFASVMDKLEPFMLNFINSGSCWIDNGIKKSQVLERMDIVINNSTPQLRNYVLEAIDESVNKGYLIDE